MTAAIVAAFGRWRDAVQTAAATVTKANREFQAELERMSVNRTADAYLAERFEEMVSERQEIRSLAQQLLRVGGTWSLSNVPDAARGRDLMTELDFLLKRCAR